MFEQLKEIEQYAIDNKIKLNHKNTKLMLFNPCKSRDFLPIIELDGHELEVVETTKLLGVVLTSDLKWSANTDYIVQRAYKKLHCGP